MTFYAYIYRDGRYKKAIRLEGQLVVVNFIKENLFAEELKICDSSDRLLLHILDGIEHVNNLAEIGIDLPTLYQMYRQKATGEENRNETKPKWEILYDRIGLSTGEIQMRKRVKYAAKSAQTVADVANLIRDTYFDAHFYSEDDTNFWCYFNDQDYSATHFIISNKELSNAWIEVENKVYLLPKFKVTHRYSSEDKHVFTLHGPAN